VRGFIPESASLNLAYLGSYASGIVVIDYTRGRGDVAARLLLLRSTDACAMQLSEQGLISDADEGRKTMNIVNSCGRACLALLLLFVIAVMPACGDSDKLEGVYISSNGQNAIDFRGTKAFVTLVGMADPDGSPFEVKGTTITIHVGGIAGDLVLNRNSDGTLQGPLGVLKKKT
jgi:hypothetical protein